MAVSAHTPSGENVKDETGTGKTSISIDVEAVHGSESIPTNSIVCVPTVVICMLPGFANPTLFETKVPFKYHSKSAVVLFAPVEVFVKLIVCVPGPQN